MMSYITYCIVTLAIDGFYNYLTFKMYIEISVLVYTRFAGNSDSLFKMGVVIYYAGFFVVLIFLCVRIEINCIGSDLLLNISLSVGQS